MSPSRTKQRLLVAIDTGGTFTDFFVIGPQGLRTHKVPSTPGDPSLAIRRGIKELGLGGDFLLVHGTTVATNALLEKKGARVAFVTTQGFEDLLQIGRQNRPHLYRLGAERPPALVEPSLRFGIRERIDAKGRILQGLDPKACRALLQRLKKISPDSIAIGLLSSYRKDRHERLLKRYLIKTGKPLSLSSEICPEYREYERFSTTCVNAYVAPVMGRYLGRLKKNIAPKIRIMQSNGGSLSLKEAQDEAVRTLLSGPAGGALGALRAARQAGAQRVLSLDIGGTSTDLSLIDEDLELTSEADVGGYPVKIPMIRIHTLGAGGGSIAKIDAGGALRVGPDSAGAEPGPIAYGRGGEALTVTDAHVALHRIDPEHFLGGDMALHADRIAPFLARMASKMRMAPTSAAEGILRVANSNIERGLRVISLERGYDPRQFTLVAFGGAGPLHACELARLLEMRQVLIPRHPGLLSAYGMAHADWVRDQVQTVLLTDEKNRFENLSSQFLKLEKKAAAQARREGFLPGQVSFLRRVDLRYRGQSYELTVDLQKNLRALFEAAHQKRFGYRHEGRPLEIVNLRLQTRVPMGGEESPRRQNPRPFVARLRKEQRIFWRGKFQKGSLYLREDLAPGAVFKGPAVISEYSATTFLPPGWVGRVDRNGHLCLHWKGSRP